MLYRKNLWWIKKQQKGRKVNVILNNDILHFVHISKKLLN